MILFLTFLLLFSSCDCEPARADTILTASWYSVASLKKEKTWERTHGIMANGEVFDENKMLAASWDFPLGTWVIVRNIANGKSVKVRITDRTARRFKGKRIDLSRRAFNLIANLKQGLVPCEVSVVK